MLVMHCGILKHFVDCYRLLPANLQSFVAFTDFLCKIPLILYIRAIFCGVSGEENSY
jgi:hypothetical protein